MLSPRNDTDLLASIHSFIHSFSFLSPFSLLSPLIMPNKYSHGLVFSQQQYRDVYPRSLKPPSAPTSTPQTRPVATSSIRPPSDYSSPSAVYSDYLRLEPDPEPEPSHDYRASTQTFQLNPSDTPQLETKSSRRSRPRSERLRLASSFGFQTQNPPSPPSNFEPTLSHDQITSSHFFDSGPSSPERLHLGAQSPRSPSNSRLYLHHKNSSVETQIYAPEASNSPSTPAERQKLPRIETYEPYPSPPSIHERQYHFPIPPLHGYRNSSSRPTTLEVGPGTSPASARERHHVISMESPETSPPLIYTAERQGRLSSETQRSHLPSPARDRRQNFVQETLASPPHIQGRQAHSPFGTQDSPLFPSARELQDYFSIQDYFSLEIDSSKSTPAHTGDGQNNSSMKARSALPTPSQDHQRRPSMDVQRLKSPLQTQDHQRRPSSDSQRLKSPLQKQDHQRHPSLGTQHTASTRGLQTSQGPVHGRRQSIDSQTTRNRQQASKKTAQQRQLRPSSSSQQLSLDQFIRESERTYTPQVSSSYTGKPGSHQATLANAQRYTPKGTSFDHSPQSRRDRPSKLPNTFASQHKTLLPTSQGAYDNVLIETHGLPLKRPPSPPATPDSSKSFSLTSHVEENQRTRHPPPIPQRSAWRSPSLKRSVLRSASSSIVHLPLDPPRPSTSSAADPPTISRKVSSLHSPTPSIRPRGSSINATKSPQSIQFSDFSQTMASPKRVSSNQSRDKEYSEDADLESLPSEVDFNILPYENPNAGPAIFRATQLGQENPISPRYENPNASPAFSRGPQLGDINSVSDDRSVSSRASSFDSAAPPPIGFKRRIPQLTVEYVQPKTPKKESKLSLLSFLRSAPAPKAVLYSEATQGKPPRPVSRSKTAVPSTSLVFAGNRGQFSSTHKPKDQASVSGPEPKKGTGLVTGKRPPRSTAHKDAAEKRKSWIKGDDLVDKYNMAARSGKKGELERILSNL